MSNSKSNTSASPKSPMEVCILDQSTEDDTMQEEKEVAAAHKEDKEEEQDKRPEGPRKNNLGKT